jgi:FixJ family two-component response regulator
LRPITVAVVDDAAAVRESMDSLLRAFGYAPVTFASAEAFLRSDSPKGADCLVADLRLPGMDGIALHHQLIEADCRIPTILMSAQLDEPAARRAREAGIVRCLHKPLNNDALMQAVGEALALQSPAPDRIPRR